MICLTYNSALLLLCRAKHWHFPISANLVNARKERETQQLLLNAV
jgi:hypothetical protein